MNAELWLIVLAAFAIGYFLVSRIFNSRQEKEGSSDSGDKIPRSQREEDGFRREKYDQDSWRRNSSTGGDTREEQENSKPKSDTGSQYSGQTEELRHGKALGLKGKVTPAEVKKAYREMLSKYHPDKVSHLGKEFQDISVERARAIIEAYEFFRKKYDIK